uniref:Uncharacterized protein n=1 Tax=Pseudo-nitzschia delicatissima TaxID=44447 RepID=A0A7S0Y907_9STRA|mmetsp:Transcript_889/g.1820  ORF Transcript_889/g.1820 Transcript_889/m.1820 type:complete len:103 (+) Transcript_889:488-796(+)
MRSERFLGTGECSCGQLFCVDDDNLKMKSSNEKRSSFFRQWIKHRLRIANLLLLQHEKSECHCGEGGQHVRMSSKSRSCYPPAGAVAGGCSHTEIKNRNREQ